MNQLPCDIFLGSHGSFFHLSEKKDRLSWEGIVALCKTNQVKDNASVILARLHRTIPQESEDLLAWAGKVRGSRG